MQENSETNTPSETKINQLLLKLICAVVGMTEPYDKESLIELVFRMQIFFPEMIIQSSYLHEKCFIKFFYDSKLHLLTVDDFGFMVMNANQEISVIESRRVFTSEMEERKARLINNCIQHGIMLLANSGSFLDKTDFLLLPEFPIRGHYKNRIYDEDIFAKKIAGIIFSD